MPLFSLAGYGGKSNVDPVLPHEYKVSTANTYPELVTNSGLRMLKNLGRALEQHGKKKTDIIEILKDIQIKKETLPLQFSVSISAKKGRRNEMEDAHFYLEGESGVVSGIFDGHGDNGKIAALAAETFKKQFFSELKAQKGDVRVAMQTLINKVHAEVKNKKLSGGSTALICYIDKSTNLLYTMTLGDSLAKVFRMNPKNNKIESIDLSRNITWSHPKEAARAAKALGDSFIATLWPESPGKVWRFPFCDFGVNVSRAIGDHLYQDYVKYPDVVGVIQRGKMSVCSIKPEDRIFLACDGLWDYYDESVFSNFLTKNWNDLSLAEKSVDFAINNRQSQDNVSVIVVSAKRKP